MTPNSILTYQLRELKNCLIALTQIKLEADEIPGIVVKRCSGVSAEPLSIIFRIIYNTRIVPSEWKLSNVVPIYKKVDKKDIKNYRPISLTSIIAKVMERIIHEELLLRTIEKN